VTAIFLRLHPEAGEIEVVNAGHNPGFLCSRARRRANLMPGHAAGTFAGDALLSERCGLHREHGFCFTQTG